MALPRKILNALRAGQYTPSNASKKAREAATRLQRQRAEQSSVETGLPRDRPFMGGQRERDTFKSVRNNVIQRKHSAYYGTVGYNPTESMRNVLNSDEYRAMQQATGMTKEQMSQFASLAARAHAAVAKTGDAGELEVYLKYDFLFYHLSIPT
jgi:hypothetical protein